jgi:hypothetical protein
MSWVISHAISAVKSETPQSWKDRYSHWPSGPLVPMQSTC